MGSKTRPLFAPHSRDVITVRSLTDHKSLKLLALEKYMCTAVVIYTVKNVWKRRGVVFDGE